jgi:hypothetical protein
VNLRLTECATDRTPGLSTPRFCAGGAHPLPRAAKSAAPSNANPFFAVLEWDFAKRSEKAGGFTATSCEGSPTCVTREIRKRLHSCLQNCLKIARRRVKWKESDYFPEVNSLESGCWYICPEVLILTLNQLRVRNSVEMLKTKRTNIRSQCIASKTFLSSQS